MTARRLGAVRSRRCVVANPSGLPPDRYNRQPGGSRAGGAASSFGSRTPTGRGRASGDDRKAPRRCRAGRRPAAARRTRRRRRPETEQVQPAAKDRPGVVDAATGVVKQSRPRGARSRHRPLARVPDLRRVPPLADIGWVRIKKLRSLPLSPRISQRHSCRGPEQQFYATRLQALERRDIPEPGLKIVFLASWRIRGEEPVVPLDPRGVLGPLPHRQPRVRAACRAWRREVPRTARRSSRVVPPQMPSGMASRA